MPDIWIKIPLHLQLVAVDRRATVLSDPRFESWATRKSRSKSEMVIDRRYLLESEDTVRTVARRSTATNGMPRLRSGRGRYGRRVRWWCLRLSIFTTSAATAGDQLQVRGPRR